MKDDLHDLHRHLDGDLAPGALDDADRNRADAWERMVASFRTAAPRGDAPPWLEQRVMAEITALPERTPARRLLAWLTSPAPVHVSPLTAGLVTAMFVLALLLPGRRIDD